ncbi:MAG: hypothetical protein QXD62_02425 [Candidatus Woesearchaeota archaeon]
MNQNNEKKRIVLDLERMCMGCGEAIVNEGFLLRMNSSSNVGIYVYELDKYSTYTDFERAYLKNEKMLKKSSFQNYNLGICDISYIKPNQTVPLMTLYYAYQPKSALGLLLGVDLYVDKVDMLLKGTPLREFFDNFSKDQRYKPHIEKFAEYLFLGNPKVEKISVEEPIEGINGYSMLRYSPLEEKKLIFVKRPIFEE